MSNKKIDLNKLTNTEIMIQLNKFKIWFRQDENILRFYEWRFCTDGISDFVLGKFEFGYPVDLIHYMSTGFAKEYIEKALNPPEETEKEVYNFYFIGIPKDGYFRR